MITFGDKNNIAVLHYTGHRISGGSVKTAFPAASEFKVASAIAAAIENQPIAAAFGSLAAGADILFAEALIQRNVQVHVTIPCDITIFKAVSVLPSGFAWGKRFDRILDEVCAIEVLGGQVLDDSAFALCTKIAACHAIETSTRLQAEAIQIAVWDGQERPYQSAGTAADVKLWQQHGLRTTTISPS